MSGSDKYFTRAKSLVKKGRSLPAAIGSDGNYVQGYTKEFLNYAVLTSLICGILIGGTIVALTIMFGYNITSLTSVQKRGIDIINSAAGWSWIDHITADDANRRLNMNKELAFIVDEIAKLPKEKEGFTPRWWQPWMENERGFIGRNEAVTIIAGWIANSPSEEKKDQLITIWRDIINIHRGKFAGVVETLARMSEEKRQQIIDNGFEPMPKDNMAKTLIKLATSMTPKQLNATVNYIYNGCPATRCPPRQTSDCPEPRQVECPESRREQCPESIDEALGGFLINKEVAFDLVKRIAGMTTQQYSVAIDCINQNSWAR